MDKQLKDVKEQFDHIPTSFTEKDKIAVREKIAKLQYKPARKRLHLYPQLLTGVVVALAILIVVVTLNQPSDLFMSQRSADSSMEKASLEPRVEEAQIETFDANTTRSITGEMEDSTKAASDDSLPDIATTTYHETIALSKDLLGIYNEYSTSFDDTLLKGLSPFDVFKLYQYARFQDNFDVEYALYIKGEDNDLYTNKEAFIADVRKSPDTNFSIEQKREYYNKLLKVDTFGEKYLTENEVLIQYNLDYPLGFRLMKDKELDVWKVSWMPIQ